MRVKTIANTGTGLSQETRDKVGYLATTRFDTRVGHVYTVYGMMLWEGILHYLVFDRQVHEYFPNRDPSELFVVKDHSLPSRWYYKTYGYDHPSGIMALWGYKELMDDNHFHGLAIRDGDAVVTFHKRKKEIDRAQRMAGLFCQLRKIGR